MPVTGKTIYTVGPSVLPGEIDVETTISYEGDGYEDDGYEGYAQVSEGGFFAIDAEKVDESKFKVNFPSADGYVGTVAITDDSDGNKVITATVTEVQNIVHYTVNITAPYGSTPVITYKGEAETPEDDFSVDESGGQFAIKEGIVPTEDMFNISNDGDYAKHYKRNLSIDTENHTISLIYTPHKPEAGKTYRLYNCFTKRYGYITEESRPIHFAQDKSASAIGDETKLFFTMEDNNDGNDATVYMKIVNTGKYVKTDKTVSDTPGTVTVGTHTTMNALTFRTDGTYHWVDWTNAQLDQYNPGHERTAFLVEEVKTAETTLSEAAEGFGTFCMDFNAIVPEGVVRYPSTPQDTDGDGLYTMTWNNIYEGSMPANTAVLIQGEAGQTYKFYETEREVTAVITDNAMTSTKETGYVYYALAKPEGYGIGFYKFTGTTLRGDRGYIRMAAQDAARVRGFIFDGDDIVTGIEAVEGQPAEDAQVYDLTGRRVAKPTNGIYVINGKKTIINK